MKIECQPCGRCGHRSVGEQRLGSDGNHYVDWEPPDPTCECVCHSEWHMFHHMKPSRAAVA